MYPLCVSVNEDASTEVTEADKEKKAAEASEGREFGILVICTVFFSDMRTHRCQFVLLSCDVGSIWLKLELQSLA